MLNLNNPNCSNPRTEFHTTLDMQQAGWLAGWLAGYPSTQDWLPWRHATSSHGAGNAEVAHKLESEADDEVPDIASDLRASDECAPQDDSHQGVEDVADVAKSAHNIKKRDVTLVFFAPLD